MARSFLARIIVLVLCIGSFLSLNGQSVNIAADVPDFLHQCGGDSVVCVTVSNVTANDTITNVRVVLGSVVSGFVLDNLTSKSGHSFSQVGDTIFLPDLPNVAPDSSVAFSLDAYINCDIGNVTSQDLDFQVLYDSTSNGDSISSITTPSIFFQSADLSIPSIMPVSIEAYEGLIDTITTEVANGGNGALDEFFYCVTANHANAQLIDIQVGGVSLAPAASPDPAFDCYLAPAIASNGTVDVVEIWMVTGCQDPSPPIERRVQFGCDGDLDCQNKAQSNFPSTDLIYDVANPVIEVESVSITRPGCYAEVPSEAVVWVINTGDAPAESIVTRLTVSTGFIDLGSGYTIEYLNGMDPESTVEVMNVESHCGGMQLRSITDTIHDVFLLPGDTLEVTYYTLGDCACNDCSIHGVYQSTFSVQSYTNTCEDEITDVTSTAFGSYDAEIDGYVEGPFELSDGGGGTIEYPITSWSLDWFNGDYPDAFLETTITIECGLDYVPNSAELVDRDGNVYPLAFEDYIDKGLGGDDSLVLHWNASAIPMGFIIGSNAELHFDVVVDCSEKPPPPDCSNPEYVVNITQTTDLVIDPACTAPCTRQKIWQPDDFQMYVYCPDPGCMCEGMVFDQFILERRTFGMGDSDNDQVADGALDMSLIEKDRFLAGDTVLASFCGSVSNPMNLNFNYGFAQIFMVHGDYTPIAATVEIFDADMMATYVCANPEIINQPSDSSILVNFSSASLTMFGCGLPMGFEYDDGDSVKVELYIQLKNEISAPVETQEFETRFFVSEDDLGMGTTYQCNFHRGFLTQVGIFSFSNQSFQNFGACNLPNWRITEGRYFGFRNVDEFPYEIRPLGIPKELTFTKPSAFEFVLAETGVRLRQDINPAHNVVNLPGGTIDSAFLIESGDDLTFLAESYFLSLMNGEIPTDEGYDFSFFPKVRANCQSVSDFYDVSFQITDVVDPGVFCVPEIVRSPVMSSFLYTGGPELEVVPEQSNITLCQPEDTVIVRVNNLNPVTAPNSYIHLESPTGAIVVNEVVNLNTNMVLTPNQFGVVEIGDIPGNDFVRLELIITANSCADEVLEIVAGWDCDAAPENIEQAACSNVAMIQFGAASTGMNIDILKPVNDTTVALCDTVQWTFQIRSTDLGFLRNISMEALLPAGLVVVPGCFEIAYPDITDGFDSVPDPDMIPGGFRYDINPQVGLIGSKDLTRNTATVRFKTVTTCDYLSGSRMLFILNGYNSCGDPLPPRIKPSRRLFTTSQVPDFSMDIDLDDLYINPCNMDTVTSSIRMQLQSGAPSTLDSVKMTLPPGIYYVPNSYVPGINASPNEPIIVDMGGGQMLIWPLTTTITSGGDVEFSVDLYAEDEQQLCLSYPILVQAYSRVDEQCGMDDCSIAVLAGEGVRNIEIIKPAFEFLSIDGMLTLDPAENEEILMVEVTVVNLGGVLDSGNTVRVDLYEDVDMNGIFSNGDAFLFPIIDTILMDVPSGSILTFSHTDTLNAGTACNIIGVLDPLNTCTCYELTSDILNPAIKFDIQEEYEVCSDDVIMIGPDPVVNYDYSWYGIDGAPLDLLSSTTTTPTMFSGTNTTDMDITYQYVLRSSYNTCYALDTVSVTVFPLPYDSVVVQACMDSTYALPSAPPGSSNFLWTPSTNLHPDDTSNFVVVDPVTTDEIYTLTYTTPEGCPGVLVVNLMVNDCGPAVASLGDTAWFDLDADGIQNGEPGIEGVQVTLRNGTTDAILGSTSTDANGFYEFIHLPPGNFVVEFGPPAGFVETLQDVGNDSLDSDIGGDGRSPNYYIGAGQHNPTIDAGFIPDCQLDLDLRVSACMPTDSGLVRRIDLIYTWSGNTYTYDQFFEDDTLDIDILSEVFEIEIDTVEGSDTLTLYRLANTTLDVNAMASFRLASGCMAQADAGSFDPCLYDLALRKVLTSPLPVSYGDTVCFDIYVYNQQVETVTNVIITDYLPSGLQFLPSENLGWGLDGSGNLKWLMMGPLAQGEVDTVSLKLEVVPSTDSAAWINYAEITSFMDSLGNDVSMFDDDSNPDEVEDNDAGGRPESPADDAIDGDGTGMIGDGVAMTDEDDHDPALVSVFDLALIKVIDTLGTEAETNTDLSNLSYGDTIKFYSVVFNQGSTPVSSYQITDYVPGGLSAANAGGLNVGWNLGNPSAPVLDQTLPQPLAMGESDTTCIYLTIEPLQAASVTTESWVNRAEVSMAMDTNGVDQSMNDADFPLNNIQGDNVGGLPNSGADDYIDGDGTATGISGSAFTDQDSEDPALVDVFDLALTKMVDNSYHPGPYMYGDTIKFLINVINQGSVTANNIMVFDSVPPGLVFLSDPMLNDIWSGPVDRPETMINSPIGPGEDTTICIYLTMQPAANGDYVNRDAIESAEDDMGNVREDMDSPLDMYYGNDAGGQPGSPADDAVDGDGTGVPGDGIAATDHDASDPALVEIVDIALYKQVDSSHATGPFVYDDTVKYIIVVENQGNTVVDDVTITDYPGSGLEFDATIPQNMAEGWTAGQELTSTMQLGFGMRDTLCLYLIVRPDTALAAYINYAEVISATDTLGMTRTDDADSEPGSNSPEENAVLPGEMGDDDIMSISRDSIGSEDDHDPAGIEVITVSLGSTVYNDVDNDGFQGMGEVGIPNVIVQLFDSIDQEIPVGPDGILGTPDDAPGGMMTDMNGNYYFENLAPGNYYVLLPGDNFQAGGALEVYAVSSDTTYNRFAGETDPDDNVDGDDDGIQSGGPGTEVRSEIITLSAGNEPDNAIETEPGGDLDDLVELNGNMTLDFGFYAPHSLGNQLWVDNNNNGLIETGEPPLAGVSVVLHYVDPILGMCVAMDTMVTDAQGLYLFDNLIAGQYIVEIPADNFEPGAAAEGFSSSSGAFAGMGPYEPAPDPDDDEDGDDNGTLDGNPNFVGSVASDTLDLFGMEPIGEMPDNNVGVTQDSLSNLTLDFGFYAPAAVGDTVWVDLNENGIQDNGEPGLEGVTVELLVWDTMTMMPVAATTDAFGNPIVPMMTDVNGHYLFDSLPPGNYLVQFDVTTANTGDGNAANWQYTYQDVGGDDALDSDADKLTGLSDTTGFLASGTRDTTLDAGVFGPRYDLALAKGLPDFQNVIVNTGDTVTMWILVANQGNVPSMKYTVTDSIPYGMEFVDADPAPVSVMNNEIQWCDSLPDTLGFDTYAVDTFMMRLYLDPMSPNIHDFVYVNWAEISQDNAGSYGVSDEDSTPDDITGNDGVIGRGDPPNDQFRAVGLDDVLLDTLPFDEDDNDFQLIVARKVDLALRKILSPSEPDNVVVTGDTVEFTLTIFNQGLVGPLGIIVDNITVVDYIPPNLQLVEEDGWMVVNDSLGARLLEDGDELMMGGLAPGDSVEIPVRFVMTEILGGETLNFAEVGSATTSMAQTGVVVPIIDSDSDLDSLNDDVLADNALIDEAIQMMDNDMDGIVDEDDHDVAAILSCVPFACYANINLSLGPDCCLEITPDMLITDPTIAITNPEFYKVTLEYGNGVPIPDNKLTAKFMGKTIKATITYCGPEECAGGTCWVAITIKGDKQPSFDTAYNKTVYCFDSLLQLDPEDPDYIKPTAHESCSERELEVHFAGDWIETYDCDPGVQDTFKIIYREWYAESGDGIRVSSIDTIIVLRPPAISADNVFCSERDTLYCGTGSFGPYMLLPDVCPDDGETDCDTIYLLDEKGNAIDLACDLSVHVDRETFASDCSPMQRYRVQIKQSCYGAGQSMNGGCLIPQSAIDVQGNPGEPLYATCDFWVIDLDTVPPLIACKLDAYEASDVFWPQGSGMENQHCFVVDAPVVMVQSDDHGCGARTHLPPLCVAEDWSGIKQVKAAITGLGSFVLNADEETCVVDSVPGVCYRSYVPIELPYSENPIAVIYEVTDSCHNVTTDTCYLLVKDKTVPVPTSVKGQTVSLNQDKVWLESASLDEGSSDNCEIATVLARREDWMSACIDLCDTVQLCYTGYHGQSIWYPVLSEVDEVEHHYAQQLDRWSDEGVDYEALLRNAWLYDLMKTATLYCEEESGGMDEEAFRHLFVEALGTDTFSRKFSKVPTGLPGCDSTVLISDLDEEARMELVSNWDQFGGGWCEEIPFSCEDVCGPVTVELLVMDYWSNWSKTWTEVWVEDKAPVEIVGDIETDIAISCLSFEEAGLGAVVALAEAGDSSSLAILDQIFGTYATEILPDLIWTDAGECRCTTRPEQVEVFDEHLGYYKKDSLVTHCYQITDTMYWQQGQIGGICSDLSIDQQVLTDLDACNQGVIYRKWTMSKGCSEGHHAEDSITRVQRIYIGSQCDLNKHMFDLPADTVLAMCEIPAMENGHIGGDLNPEHTGTPEYLFGNTDCRLLGIAYQDKIFRIVGGDAFCYKILRTWYLGDWCGGKPGKARWWQDDTYLTDKYVQQIYLLDTIAPEILITGPVEDGGEAIAAGSCTYDLNLDISTSDSCGIESIAYELIQDSVGTVVDFGTLEGDVNQLSIGDLPGGSYELRVRATDACQNESYASYHLTVTIGKKPKPVCVTAITAVLQGLDSDSDGAVDSATARVWANEFNASSLPACGGSMDELEFRLDILDGLGDDSYEDDTTYVDVNCSHLPAVTVRLWVIDPSGVADYCDVVLNVSDNGFLCGDISANGQEVGPGNYQKYEHEDQVRLLQNRPNPFGDKTRIGFYLPYASDCTLTFYDQAGNMLKVIKGYYRKGFHEEELEALDFGHSGIIHYQLDTDRHTVSKRMIVIK